MPRVITELIDGLYRLTHAEHAVGAIVVAHGERRTGYVFDVPNGMYVRLCGPADANLWLRPAPGHYDQIREARDILLDRFRNYRTHAYPNAVPDYVLGNVLEGSAGSFFTTTGSANAIAEAVGRGGLNLAILSPAPNVIVTLSEIVDSLRRLSRRYRDIYGLFCQADGPGGTYYYPSGRVAEYEMFSPVTPMSGIPGMNGAPTGQRDPARVAAYRNDRGLTTYTVKRRR